MAERSGERLQKVLARVGIGSRRACEELIAGGRVTVNGEVAVLGRRIDPAADRGRGGRRDPRRGPGLVHYLLNKPAGVVTTAEDTHGRSTVCDLVPAEPRVLPGRATRPRLRGPPRPHQRRGPHLPAHPSLLRRAQGVPGTVEGDPAPGALRRLREGVDLETGPRRRPGWRRWPRAHSASSSTRAGTDRFGGCARRSAIPSRDWSGRGSDPSPTRPSPPEATGH